MTVISLP